MEITGTFQEINSILNGEVTSFVKVCHCPTSGSKSVHAAVNLRKNQILSKFETKEVLDKPNYLTVQINEFQHIMLDPEWMRYINHGCDPNVFFDVDDQILVTLRDVEINEELRFFYPATEWLMDNSFDCTCNSPSCLGRIQGAAFLPIEILRQYRLSQHLSQRLGL